MKLKVPWALPLWLIVKPMRRRLQIATDDVNAHDMIGEGGAQAVATANIVPLTRAMRTEACCCWAGCYGWRRPRTKLREDPYATRLCYGTPTAHGGHGHGRRRGAHAKVQLHGHHWQRRPNFGVSEAAWISAQSSRLRFLPGHDQLVSAGIQGPVFGSDDTLT